MGGSSFRPAQAALEAPRAAEPHLPATRPAPPRAEGISSSSRPSPAVGLSGVASLPPTQCTQARSETRLPCRLRRRGVFSTKLRAGPWTHFQQVLPVLRRGQGVSSGLRNVSPGEPSVPVRAPPAGSSGGYTPGLGTTVNAPPACRAPRGAVEKRMSR